MSDNANGRAANRSGRTRVRIGLGVGLFLIAVAGGVAVWKTRPDPEPQPEPVTRQTSLAPAEPTGTYTGLPWFRDATAESGIQFTYRNGEEADQFTILESLGGGVALFDFDGDGKLDIFITGGGTFDGTDRKQIRGQPCRLYKNLGNFRFRDVTKDVGLDINWWYTHGVAVADYDRDGWPDLLVTGYGKLALFHNEPDGNGGRGFVDVTEKLGLNDDLWTTGAGWADLDGDGFPDLYVCRYCDWSLANDPPCVGQSPGISRDICPPHRFKPLTHAVYHNDAGKRLRDITAEMGTRPEGYGLGVILTDLNDDGRPDFYVTNDMTRNLLYMNRGNKLEETALIAGVAFDEAGRATASMGADAEDYDGSGRPSLFVTNFQRELPSLFRNLGRERFYYQSGAAELAALGRTHVGWGTGFFDADNDGWPDLVIANGHLFRHPAGTSIKQPPLLLRNLPAGDRRVFRNAGTRGGAYFQTPTVGRGVAIGDLDNDGWPDLVISHTNAPVSVLRNDVSKSAPHHWLGVKLVGKRHRDVIGSTVTVETPTRTLTRFAKGGGSYLSASDRRTLVGLGPTERVTRVSVRWSWGETQTWDDVPIDRYHEFREGEPALH